MSKRKISECKLTELSRKCSPLSAATMGAAICLAGGTANAVSGNVGASNGGTNTFNAGPVFKMFGSLFNWAIVTSAGSGFISQTGARFGAIGLSLYHAPAGVNVGGIGFGNAIPKVGHNTSNNYLGVKITSGPKYGWVHVISTNATGTQIKLDTWSYNNTINGAIKTLDESITPRKLALSDGRVKLNWSNANEDGVARYEVQGKGASGAWSAVDSSAPGEGSYAATVQSGEYRLVIENSDGTKRTLAF